MKKTILSALIISAISFGAKAQYIASDSVNLGPGGYLNDVFYSFKNGSIKTQPNSDWHLAFSVQASQFPTNPETGASIRVNTKLVLKKLPSSQSASNWRNIDTAGLYALPELLNSDTTWDLGAFNAGYDKSGANIFDFKWGAYNQSTHNLEGTNVFVMIGSGIYKKIFISQLDQDTAWRFIISNLDNTDSSSVVIRK
ncbi:MAG: hypothetical protein H7321_06765 [Bacteroidia bacterium]|nr:hypothetical protein [Bacteroidia bacterium]